MKDPIEILQWDTDFFGYTVAKINYPILNINNCVDVIELLKKNKVVLGYYFSSESLSLYKVPGYKIKLVDKKITYSKNNNLSAVFSPNVRFFESKIVTQELINLSIQSGEYSRFKKDRRIKKEKFEEMYRLWIINSVNKKIADAVLVSEEKNKIIGSVTLAEKSNAASIGIIAVDRNYRGKGIGKSLMISAESWAVSKGLRSVEVDTQKANKGACNFYESCGYSMTRLKYVYHFWEA